ncbi:uncharacterized oxidoreductase ZK1290.5-like [Centruroides sculpturatus]|uniref:uncharacterized oxidoreductase ZK1290.5-like n=1 Tax=Centruroides sculpturatus TaxID=218467 RepID=UPI000C6E4A6B|nr:uncharacterized oxidoreductase ZK1290.5-like [Centruroides sculpturatus]
MMNLTRKRSVLKDCLNCNRDEYKMKVNPVTYVNEREQLTTIELRNGVKMPLLGIGTSHSGGYSHNAVVYALKKCGYRLIDTAKRYGCEIFLKDAIKESGVNREDIFLTTKLWPTDYGSISTRKAFYEAMERLGVDYLDLFMLHWPLCPSTCSDKWNLLHETWRTLECLLDEGRISAIGVSNCNIDDLVKFQENCTIVPHVNQVEFHPYHNLKDLRDYCNEYKIQFEGYCPLGKGKLLKEKPIIEVAKHCNRTPAQVLIRWSIQNEVITIPKSTKIERVKENSMVFDFVIPEKEMNILNNLNENRRYIDISNMQYKIDNPQPDGYKLKMIADNGEEKLYYRNHRK